MDDFHVDQNSRAGENRIMDVKKRMRLTGGLMKVLASECDDVDQVLENKEEKLFAEVLAKVKDDYFPLTLAELTAKERDYLCSPVVDCLFKVEQNTFRRWVKELAKGGHLSMIKFIYKKWRFKFHETMLDRVGNHTKVIEWFKNTFDDEVCPYIILEQNVHLLTPVSFEFILKLFDIVPPGDIFVLSSRLNLVLFEYMLVEYGPWHIGMSIFDCKFQKNYSDAFTILSKHPQHVASIQFSRRMREVSPSLLRPLADKFDDGNAMNHINTVITRHPRSTLWSEEKAREALEAGWEAKALWRQARSPEVFDYLMQTCEEDVAKIENPSVAFARWTIRKYPKIIPTAAIRSMDNLMYWTVEDMVSIYVDHFGLSKVRRHTQFTGRHLLRRKDMKRKMYE